MKRIAWLTAMVLACAPASPDRAVPTGTAIERAPATASLAAMAPTARPVAAAPAQPLPAATVSRRDFAVVLDPPSPAPGTTFFIVVTGVEPGEQVELTVTPTGSRGVPTAIPANAQGEVRSAVPDGQLVSFTVSARRPSGEVARAAFGGASEQPVPPGPSALSAPPTVAPAPLGPPAAASATPAASVTGARCPGTDARYAVCGRATTEDRRPLPGARATIWYGHDVYASGATDADGRFTIGMSALRFLLLLDIEPASGSGLVLRWWKAPCSYVSPNLADLLTAHPHLVGADIVVPRGFKVGGVLRDQSGAPFRAAFQADARATVDGVFNEHCDVQDPQAVFDASTGAWQRLLPRGQYRITYGAYGADPYVGGWWPDAVTASSARDLVVNGDMSGIDLVMRKGVRVSGVVRHERARFAAITLVVGERGAEAFGTAAQADGTFAMYVLPGTYRLKVQMGDTIAYWRSATDLSAADTFVVTGERSVEIVVPP